MIHIKYIRGLGLFALICSLFIIGFALQKRINIRSTVMKNGQPGVEIKWVNRVALPIDNGPMDTNGKVKWFPCESDVKTCNDNVIKKPSKEMIAQALADMDVNLEQNNKLPLGAIEPDYKLRKVFEDGHLWAIVEIHECKHASVVKLMQGGIDADKIYKVIVVDTPKITPTAVLTVELGTCHSVIGESADGMMQQCQAITTIATFYPNEAGWEAAMVCAKLYYPG